ncbi:MAG: ribonuclease PH [Deltaproteobacteria bacterium]|nr:ribonuclease PH [Deltaproteobacteria bacterium]MBW2360652.1 ribonuclease PH [Deltaproteobacteria bacterium]
MSRKDGRVADELRPVRITTDFTENPLASVLIEMGRTRVLCTVCEEASVPRWMAGRGRGWITAEYSMLPGSTDRRSDREASRGKVSGRTQEIQRLIGRSLRAIADLDVLGERSLWIDCDVLQADGGTRCASISGAYVALALGVERLRARGELTASPLRDSVAAVSAGVVAGEVLLDLPYEEDSRADVDMNVIATGSGRFVEIQGTGEEATFSRGELDALTELALGGIAALTREQQRALAAALP